MCKAKNTKEDIEEGIELLEKNSSIVKILDFWDAEITPTKLEGDGSDWGYKIGDGVVSTTVAWMVDVEKYVLEDMTTAILDAGGDVKLDFFITSIGGYYHTAKNLAKKVEQKTGIEPIRETIKGPYRRSKCLSPTQYKWVFKNVKLSDIYRYVGLKDNPRTLETDLFGLGSDEHLHVALVE